MGEDELVTGGDVDDPSVDSISTESLVIGGTLYEEDDNSPINVTGTSSTTFTPATTYDEVILLADPQKAGFNQVQVNGDTNANYDYVDNSDTKTTGSSQWPIPYGNGRWYLTIRDGGNDVRLGVGLAAAKAGFTVEGQNKNLGGNGITQLTLSDSGGTNRDAKTRVFGREI